jgi:hypothetical protein
VKARAPAAAELALGVAAPDGEVDAPEAPGVVACGSAGVADEDPPGAGGAVPVGAGVGPGVVVLVVRPAVTTKKPLTLLPVTWPGATSPTNV